MGFPVHALVGAAIATALVVAGSAARADAVQDLAAVAGKKGPVIWYESSPPEAVLKIAAAFNKRYPDIKIQFVRNTGGGGIAARIIQESEAGAATASFFIGDVAQLIPLNQRTLLLSRDWNESRDRSHALPYALCGCRHRRARRPGLEQAAGGGWRSAQDLG